jgi:hypothetical protein
MPVDYVEELKRYPARPNIVRPSHQLCKQLRLVRSLEVT